MAGDFFAPPMMGETPAFSWAGGYVGAVGGYNMNKDLTYETYGTSIFEYPYHLEGFSYGAKAGYNFDVNTFIVGIEGDIEKSTVTGGFYNAPNLALLNPGGIGEDTTSWQGSIRARMGITADRFLVFGTGGYAFAQMQNKYTNPTAKISNHLINSGMVGPSVVGSTTRRQTTLSLVQSTATQNSCRLPTFQVLHFRERQDDKLLFLML